MKAEDKDRRILVEVWDWDRLSGNDFMGSLSFGISEIIKSPVEGWFKLLSEEEGEFYNVPVTDGIDTEVFRKQIRQKASVISTAKPKEPSRFDTEIPHNMSRKDIIRATDFNFLMVLGKGSFGKVRLDHSIDRSSHFNSARSSGHTQLCRAITNAILFGLVSFF